MTPDDGDYDARRIDGLLASFGELMAIQHAHAERLTGLDREVVAGREERRETTRTMAAMDKAMREGLEKIDRSCGEKVDAVRRDIAAEAQKAEARKERAQLSTWQRVGIGIAALGPLLTALAMVVK